MKKCLIKKLIPIEAAPHDVMQVWTIIIKPKNYNSSKWMDL